MIKGEYEKLNELAKYNVCAEHKTSLEVAWYSAEKCYVLRCGEKPLLVDGLHRTENRVYQDAEGGGHYPDSVTRQLSLTQEYKAGAEIPEPIKSNIIKRQRRKAMTREGQKTDERDWLLPKVDLATGELLVPEIITALVNYARRYELDPYRSHVVMMYSKPYITIDGYLYHARRTGKPYTLQSRPMTTEELTQYKVGETDHGWLAKVSFPETKEEFNGVGIVTYEEMTAKSPRDQAKLRSPVVAAHPWQLCQKRAEWQALRRAFPIGASEEIKEANSSGE